MNLKSTFLQFAFFIILNFTATQTVSSQCFQIESVLVDACGQEEGLNEMVRFKVGQTALNTTSLSVNWPNNPWQGLVKNNVTASKTAALNADILDAGGCGQLLEPVNGVLPANANVILVTSFNMDTQLNSFGALTETIYIIYQNNPTTASGHFANSGTGNRTLTISFGSCSDTITYNRALLVDTNGQTIAADGATVLFTASGSPTYINNGCSAPVPPFTVDAGLNSVNACAGETITLNGAAQGHSAVRWSAASGIFSNASNLNTNYILSQTATGIIDITLTATNSCGVEITDIIRVQVTNSRIPDFPTTIELCTGSIAPVLNATSPNGIVGNWTPSIINNNVGGSYRFEPNANQCATGIVLQVNVTNSRIPDFPTTLELCTGSIAPVLNATSPNGISGNWTPSIINNNVGGSYRFVPNANQCAQEVILQVSVSHFDFDIQQGCEDTTYMLRTKLNDDTLSDTFEYKWTDSSGKTIGSSQDFNISEIATDETVFPQTYTLEISENGGCSSIKKSVVAGIFCSIPKGISPNNDAKNDVFDLTGLGVQELVIFNRYGTEVYRCSNYTIQWNGTSKKGELLPVATYYYSIATYSGQNFTGWVYLNY